MIVSESFSLTKLFIKTMGYANSVVEESLKQQKFDDCYASYLLLGKRNTDVSVINMYYQVEQTKNLCVVLVSA